MTPHPDITGIHTRTRTHFIVIATSRDHNNLCISQNVNLKSFMQLRQLPKKKSSTFYTRNTLYCFQLSTRKNATNVERYSDDSEPERVSGHCAEPDAAKDAHGDSSRVQNLANPGVLHAKSAIHSGRICGEAQRDCHVVPQH